MSTNPIDEAKIHGDTLHIDFWYPRDGMVKYMQIGLYDVRAADDIRVSYDFERDGWKIEQQVTEADENGSTVCEEGVADVWKEVAFVKAWANQKPYTKPGNCSLCGRPRGTSGAKCMQCWGDKP